jgi:hypothetical protein
VNRRLKQLALAAFSMVFHALLLLVVLHAPSTLGSAIAAPQFDVSLYDGPLPMSLARPAAPKHPAPSPPTEPDKKEVPPPKPADIPPRYLPVNTARPNLDLRDPKDDPLARAMAVASRQAGRPCALTAWLQQALQDDPLVQAALREIPRPSRSVANALMLWNGSWAPVSASAAAGVSTIETAVVVGVLQTPESCRSELIRGPELMTLVSGEDATVIAIGSGEWRWADLLPMPESGSLSPRI